MIQTPLAKLLAGDYMGRLAKGDQRAPGRVARVEEWWDEAAMLARLEESQRKCDPGSDVAPRAEWRCHRPRKRDL